MSHVCLENVLVKRLVAISDFFSPTCGDLKVISDRHDLVLPFQGKSAVMGGYLERLPLAALAAGEFDSVEVWSFTGRAGTSDSATGRWTGSADPKYPGLTRRVFQVDRESIPYCSTDAVEHLSHTPAPDIMCVWGLGVDEAILDAAGDAVCIYNSIDAPPLRIPDHVAQRFDLFLSGAEWQSDDIRARIPGARVLVLPIGPEFASDEMFYPTGAVKVRDIVYVACAQSYKRHDVLFDALERPPGTKALLVIGYGHLRDEFEREVAERGLDVEIIGPPGVSHAEVNRLINRARVGVVCGRDDGAPAILTEYQLADLPVLANAELSCRLQFITPETGLVAAPGSDFANAMGFLIDHAEDYDPRPVAIERWGWRTSIAKLLSEIDDLRSGRAGVSR